MYSACVYTNYTRSPKSTCDSALFRGILRPLRCENASMVSQLLPSGGSDIGGERQYMWYPRSQSSQNNSWSFGKA